MHTSTTPRHVRVLATLPHTHKQPSREYTRCIHAYTTTTTLHSTCVHACAHTTQHHPSQKITPKATHTHTTHHTHTPGKGRERERERVGGRGKACKQACMCGCMGCTAEATCEMHEGADGKIMHEGAGLPGHYKNKNKNTTTPRVPKGSLTRY
jgi:hypothetical protein